MDLLKALLENTGSADKIGQAAGIDASAAADVIGKLMPALTQKVQSNVQGGGLDSLTKALQSGNHQQYIDNPAALGTETAREEGNGILGHLLGGKDASRALAAQVGGDTGVDVGAVKKMLPMVAALAMGALSKQTDGGQSMPGNSDMLGNLLGGIGGSSEGLGAISNLAKKLF